MDQVPSGNASHLAHVAHLARLAHIAHIAHIAHVVQGCIVYHNWWPLLTAFAYVLVPMPYLFFADDNLQGGWVDASKFLTGAAAIGTVAVPAVLYAAHTITRGALYMEILAVVLMGGSLVAYDQLSEESSAGGFYSAL